MDRLIPFLLEDFFYEYEHSPGLINLASSDALPWSKPELSDKLSQSMDVASYAYPDVRHHVVPFLKAACNVPSTWSVLPTAGAAEAIAVAMHELVAGGKVRSIGIPSPSYGAFLGLANLLGIEVHAYHYQEDRGWALDESELMALATKCDAVVVVNPHNPTGRRIEGGTINKLADVLGQRDRTLLIDEVFRIHDETSAVHKVSNSGCDVVVVGSLSKTYGLPGMRFGWVIARESHISRMRTVQQYLTLSISAHVANSAHAILNSLGAFSRAELIACNRQVLLEWAAANRDQVSISPPQGGTTVAVEFTSEPTASEAELFKAFVKAGVLLVPGSKFGPSDKVWFRLGYGAETIKLRDGLERVNLVARERI